MKKKFCAVAAVCVFILSVSPSAVSAFGIKNILYGKSELIEGKTEQLSYFLSLPSQRKSVKKTPIVLVFHGAGENPQKVFQRSEGEATKRDFALLVPAWTAPLNNQYPTSDDFKRFLNEIVLKHPALDKEKLILVAVSAGMRPVRDLIQAVPSAGKGVVFVVSAPNPKSIFTKHNPDFNWPPTLFVLGKNDEKNYPRIIAAARAFKNQGVKMNLLVDPAAGHEFREEWNKIMFDWIENQLKESSKSTMPVTRE